MEQLTVEEALNFAIYDWKEPILLGEFQLSKDEAFERAIRVVCKRLELPDNPGLDRMKTVEVFDGPQAIKFVLWGIRDDEENDQPERGNLHLQTVRRTKARGWELEPEHSITIDHDSTVKLHMFLSTLPQLETEGEYLVFGAADAATQLLAQMSGSSLDAGLLSAIVDLLTNTENAENVAKLASDKPTQAVALAAAVNYPLLSRRLEEFRRLVEVGCGECDGCINEKGCLEKTFQKFLEENYWIFGSEYSSKLEDRNLIHKGEFDFPMRTTADGYLEVIEIKHPRHKLFNVKKRRYVETEVVWDAINQVDDYLARIDKQWPTIREEYKDLGLENVRGKVVIGQSNKSEEKERVALRRLNARLSRIEVITYDQLIATAQRMLDVLGKQRATDDSAPNPTPPPISSVNDIPF